MPLLQSLTTYGFPSGHVTGAIVFYGLAFGCQHDSSLFGDGFSGLQLPLSGPARVVLVGTIATCVGLARMLALAHLPCDVVGAVPLGLLVLPPCLHLSRKYMNDPRTKYDPVRPSRRIASANIAMGSLLLLVAIRLLKPQVRAAAMLAVCALCCWYALPVCAGAMCYACSLDKSSANPTAIWRMLPSIRLLYWCYTPADAALSALLLFLRLV